MIKKRICLNNVMCSGKYQQSLFKPFDSFSDAKKNVKALAAVPIVNLYLALQNTLTSLVSTTFGVANIAIGAVTFDFEELKGGRDLLTSGAKNLVSALYHAVSIIFDTLATLVCLVTHSLATVALGIRKTGEVILDCFTPSQLVPS